MIEEARRRGRPKGTGIDDSRTLFEIARLISTDPRLKPTTAIRALGIEDPSAVRRLRDKYKAQLRAMSRQASSREEERTASLGLPQASAPVEPAGRPASGPRPFERRQPHGSPSLQRPQFRRAASASRPLARPSLPRDVKSLLTENIERMRNLLDRCSTPDVKSPLATAPQPPLIEALIRQQLALTQTLLTLVHAEPA